MFFAWDAPQIVSTISWFPLPITLPEKSGTPFLVSLHFFSAHETGELRDERTPSRERCGGQRCSSELLGLLGLGSNSHQMFSPQTSLLGMLQMAFFFSRMLHTCKVRATSWKESWVQDKTSLGSLKIVSSTGIVFDSADMNDESLYAT